MGEGGKRGGGHQVRGGKRAVSGVGMDNAEVQSLRKEKLGGREKLRLSNESKAVGRPQMPADSSALRGGAGRGRGGALQPGRR